MNCVELQECLPDVLDGVRTPEQEKHLQLCAACHELVSDLELISSEAKFLRATDEPSPRVWNSIAIALKEEGLIREPQSKTETVRQPSRGWGAWMLPVAAALLVTAGVVRYEQRQPATTQTTVAQQASPAPEMTANLQPDVASTRAADPEDEELLKVVASHSPSMRPAYEADLQSVNAYIRDAEQSVHTNPNDEDAQQYLMGAYEQKAVVYQMALDRSLP